MKNRFPLIAGVFIVFILICHVQCSKQALAVPFELNEPDSLLHTDSKYIAVFGDIQEYTSHPGYMPYYVMSLDWITEHSDKIPFVLHTGDVTNYNRIWEWETFHETTEPYTHQTPFYTCIGNHDYYSYASNPWNQRDSTRFNDYVGFQSTFDHIVAWYDTLNYENIIVREELFNDRPIYLLILELETRKDVLHWADSIVKTYPNEKFILITHRYLTANAKRYTYLQYMTDDESSHSQYVWENLIYNNDNIRCVLCGHVSSLSRVLYSTNITGRIIPQIEFNIQKLPHGGDGLIELWEFDRNNDVYIRIFDTQYKMFVDDTISEFQFRL